MSNSMYRDEQGRWSMIKDPQATLDYSFDWTAWLAGVADVISGVSYAFSGGLVKVFESRLEGVATVVVSGGSIGSDASITCTVTTAGGRVDQRTLMINIQDR